MHRRGEVRRIAGIRHDRDLAHRLGEDRKVRHDHRYSARGGLQRRQTEPLGEAREHDRVGRGVEHAQVMLADVVHESDPIASGRGQTVEHLVCGARGRRLPP